MFLVGWPSGLRGGSCPARFFYLDSKEGGIPPKAGKTVMYCVYILQSQNFSRYYIGYTDHLKERLTEHNLRKVRSTKAYVPWIIIYKEEFKDKTSARKRELQIKSYKGGEAFRKLIGGHE